MTQLYKDILEELQRIEFETIYGNTLISTEKAVEVVQAVCKRYIEKQFSVLKKCDQTFEHFIYIIGNIEEMGVEIDVDGSLRDTLRLAQAEIRDAKSASENGIEEKKPEQSGIVVSDGLIQTQ